MTAFHPLPQRLNGSESFQSLHRSWSSRVPLLGDWHPDWVNRGMSGAGACGVKRLPCHLQINPPKKGTECFRVSVIKPANLAWGRVWGWGKHSWADVPFVGLNELAGLGERKAARLDLLWPRPSLSFSLCMCRPLPGWQARFIYSTGVHSCCQRIASNTHGSIEQFRSMWATPSHAKPLVLSELSLFPLCEWLKADKAHQWHYNLH